jgi:hypothetical protein
LATYAIGDVHGQRSALEDLLARIEAHLAPADTISQVVLTCLRFPYLKVFQSTRLTES